MGVENDIFGSEIGSGFGVPGGTPPLRFLRSTPPPQPQENKMGSVSRRQSRQFFQFPDSATFCYNMKSLIPIQNNAFYVA